MVKKPGDDLSFSKSIREVGPYMGLGLQLAATIVGLLLLGSWLDKKFDQNYLFTLIMGFLGIFVGMYNLIKTVNQHEKRKKNKDEEK